MRPWIRSLSNILPKRPLRDDFLDTHIHTHTNTYKHITWYRESNSNNKSKYKINKQIRVQNAFSTFPKAWNQSFDWILSGFYPLPTIECIIWLDIQWIWSFTNRSKHFCARVLPGRRAPARAQKMFRPISKGANSSNIQSNNGIDWLSCWLFVLFVWFICLICLFY